MLFKISGNGPGVYLILPEYPDTDTDTVTEAEAEEEEEEDKDQLGELEQSKEGEKDFAAGAEEGAADRGRSRNSGGRMGTTTSRGTRFAPRTDKCPSLPVQG